VDFDSDQSDRVHRAVFEGQMDSDHPGNRGDSALRRCDIRNVLASHHHRASALVTAHCDLSARKTKFEMGGLVL
jgi:hypothetical protein